jgi:hypothetical protein
VSSYANLDAREGSVTSSETITFNWKPRKIIIINDSATRSMKFKLNTSETYATLRATETFSAEMASKTLTIESEDGIASVPYRIWGIG